MKKRVLSIILVLCLMIGFLPPSIAFAAEYERWGGIIRIGRDAGDGSWAWETFVDYDDPALARQSGGELPKGVSFDAQTNMLTLTDTEITNLQVEHWAETPLRIVISGEVTINGSGYDNLPSLLIDGSYAVTISGKSRSDTLKLHSTTSHALRFGCFVPYSESELEGHLTNPDGRLVVENLTLEATSDYSGNNFNLDERWNWIAISLTGGAHFDNVALTANGYYGIDTSGDVTYDGCDVTTSTVSFASLERRMGENDPTTEYECESLIKDSTFTITASGEPGTEEFAALMRVHRNVLTIDGSSNITIDASKAPPALAPLAVAGHHELKQAGPAAGLNMKAGTLKIKLQDGDELEGVVDFLDSVRIENGANWTQTGGAVTVIVNSGECADETPLETHAVTVGDGASFNLQGGTFTVNNINGEDVYSTKVMALCGWEDSSLNFSGGTFNATGTADKPYDVAVWVYDEMAVTGDAVLNLKGALQTDSRTSHIEIFDGTININSVYECINIGSALSVYGGELNLTAPAYMEGIYAYRSCRYALPT